MNHQSCAGVFQTAQESLGVLPDNCLDVNFTGITQHHAKDPAVPTRALVGIDWRSKSKIERQLFAGLAFQALNSFMPPGSQLAAQNASPTRKSR